MSHSSPRRARRAVIQLVVAGCVALGLVAVPGTFATPDAPARRTANQLPALASGEAPRQRAERPVGDSSSRRHGGRRVRDDRVSAQSLGDDVTFTAAAAPPPATGPVEPTNGATVLTTTPKLKVAAVTDPDGDAVSYRFKVTTRSDAESGTVALDVAVPTPEIVVPDGALKDGVTYFWHVYTSDASTPAGVTPGWVASFQVDLRLGARPALPLDSVGPVQVNLTNGNLFVNGTTPTMNTLGGPLGVTFAYNSRAPSSDGLIGSYTADANANRVFDAAETPKLVRRDPQLDFDWAGGSPAAGLPSDNLLVRWSGYVTAPATGSYLFGATASDGVRIRIGSTLVVDQWVNQDLTAPAYGTAITLTQDVRVPITVEYYDAAGASYLRLYAKGGVGNPMTEALVPASWLSTDLGVLPKGWTLSPTGGSGLAYLRAEVSDTRVVLVGPDGDTHVYTANGTTGGYTPPKDEDGVLARSDAGLLTMSATDGREYVFDAVGVLQSATAAGEKTTAHTYQWGGGSGTPRLEGIKDPVSNRTVVLSYGGSSACVPPAGAGFDTSAPPGMLCRVQFWDGRATNLYYVNRNLARIENPGDAITDFAYSGGRLTKVRDALAADHVNQGLRLDDDTTKTLIDYDAPGRVATVTLPAPLAGATRPGHSFDYTSTTETRVHVAGLTEPNGFARKVTYDAEGRLVTETDATNRSTTTEWQGEIAAATIDAAGLKSTNIYDWVDRLTDTYGPAPSAWFGPDRKPLSAYVPLVPHQHFGIDEGWKGLDVTYFDNGTFTGTPVGHALGPAAGGELKTTWATSPPGVNSAPGSPWSARFTGEVLFDQVGNYVFRPATARRTRVYVDDLLVVDTGTTASGTYNNLVAATRHRIRVEFTTSSNAAEPGGDISNFAYTGGAQSATAPAGSDTATIEAWGAQGGSGLGGYTKARIPVTAGETLQVNVGGQGGAGGGWNGGGAPGGSGATGGGGSTDVRKGGTAPGNRVVVAAGGGGDGGGNAGGAGGGLNGGNGAGGAGAGTGGTQSAGGSSGGGSPSGGGGGGAGSCNSVCSGGGGGGYAGGGGGSTEVVPYTYTYTYSYTYTYWVTVGEYRCVDLGEWGGYVCWWDGYSYEATGVGYATATATAYNYYAKAGGGGSSYAYGSATGVTMTAGARSGSGAAKVTFVPAGNTLDLRWTPPGGTEAVVPGDKLAPRYGLQTSAIDPDGHKSTTGYTRPELGLATSVTVDPAGLNLTSTNTFEPADTSFLRPLTRQLPKGATSGAKVEYAHYGATEMATNPCPAGGTFNQGGLAKSTAEPDPDGSGPQSRIVREQVQDDSGQVVARRIVGDATWNCDEIDGRGRPLKHIDTAGAVTVNSYLAADRVVTTSPDSSGAIRTTSALVDLLGRPIRYQDELGTWTRSVYDQMGRVTATYRTFAGQPETQLTNADYDAAGRMTWLDEMLAGRARRTTYEYDSAGRLTKTTRPNSFSTTDTFDATSGRMTSRTHQTPSNQPVTHTQVFDAVGTQSFTVPPGVGTVTIEAWGAQGGSSGGGGGGGLGGYAKARVPVTAGESLQVNVGSRGATSAAGGNGGGGAGSSGGGGGGASDVRRGGTALGNRVVAGGGGGGGGGTNSGGIGGGASGGDGVGTAVAATGGSQVAGGSTGGGLGVGGSATCDHGFCAGGGGGGLYGGGAGGVDSQTTTYEATDYYIDYEPIYEYRCFNLPDGEEVCVWIETGEYYEVEVPYTYTYDVTDYFPASGAGGSSLTTGADGSTLAGSRAGDGKVQISWSDFYLPAYDYTYTPAGKITTETSHRPQGDVQRVFTYDAAGRLTTVGEGSAVRRYAYDANTNRCGLAATCEPTAWVYDDADRLLSSPRATSYTYSTHGNLVSAAPRPGSVATAEAIAYDANDHAVTIDDGATTVADTVGPSGRVLRHRVTNNVTGAVLEDTLNGYDDGGDSPAYTLPAAGGPVTTFVSGAAGLLVIDQGGVGTWPLTNIHGDIVGRTDAAHALVITTPADEFGIGPSSPDHLGWLGSQQRSTADDALGLVRMGVRLYDPALGRFLQVDPVEGGSANDYDYVNGDPVNNLDLAGTICWSCAGRHIVNGARKVASNPVVQAAAAVAACSTGVGCGYVIAAEVGWNAGRRLREKGAGKAFVAGTALDVGLALLPVRPVRGLERPMESAFGRPLIYATEHADWRRATMAGRLGWNTFVGALGVARSHLPF